jgi:hypothetical protein
MTYRFEVMPFGRAVEEAAELPEPVRLTVTCSPTGQNCCGRKCSSRALNQCQPLGTGRDSVMLYRHSSCRVWGL